MNALLDSAIALAKDAAAHAQVSMYVMLTDDGVVNVVDGKHIDYYHTKPVALVNVDRTVGFRWNVVK